MSKLQIIHELDSKELQKTLRFFKDNYYDEISLCHIDQISKELSVDSEILILHLSLDEEINTHKIISESLNRIGIKQLNPFKEIMDDKYLFYNHMLANEIPQAQSLLVSEGEKADQMIEVVSLNTDKVVVKPRHGTENIDVKVCRNIKEALAQIEIIHQYDDALIQELVSGEEKRLLYFKGDIHPKSTSDETHAVFDAMEVLNHEGNKTEIVSFDFINSNGILVPIEANARPAGIFKVSLV